MVECATTLQDISLTAQIAGVLLIPASLFFVGIQMRQAHALARAESQRDLLKSIGVFLQMTLDNPRVLGDIRHGLQAYDSASAETRSNFTIWAFAYLHVMEQGVYMKAHGLITDSSFNGFEIGALGIIVTPGGSQWWAHTRKIIGASVSEHLDKRLAELGGVTPPIHELLTQFAPVDKPAS